MLLIFISKYAQVIPLKHKKRNAISNAFQKSLNESNCKPNKISVDKRSEFYNRSMKPWIEKNAIEMYSAHNEGKSVVTERFTGTLKSRIFKHMTSTSKIVYIEKLDDIVNKYNNTYHSTIKMKPVDVKPNTYIHFSKEINEKDSNFKLVILLEYQNIKINLQRVTLQIGLKKFLWLRKLKILFLEMCY